MTNFQRKESLRLYKFHSIDMLLQDPFFVKSLLMKMYNHADPKTIKEDSPEMHDFLIQMFDEEAVVVEENWLIPNASFEYCDDILSETAIEEDRYN